MTSVKISRDPTLLNIKLNDYDVNFEVDSGSHVSTINHNVAVMIGGQITPTFHKIISYSGNSIPLCGQISAKITFNKRTFTHVFLVVNYNSVNLFGRDLLSKFDMNITCPSNNIYNDVLHNYKSYLSEDFVSSVTDTVSLEMSNNVKPIFVKARTVPIRLEDKVKIELKRLVDAGTISKVYSSDWASPIVNVLKKDGSLRICGDFSTTVNKFLKPVNSTLPTIDEVISKVGNATVFSKIDLANAYLQIPLNDESKHLTTINTSDGLYVYNYLPFGLSVSPGLFQAYMCKILNDLSNVIVYQDDILIMSSNISDHNTTLSKIFNVLQEKGIKLNIAKSKFFNNSVDYLGYIFSDRGVHPNPDKVRAIVEAPVPKDTKQLQSFLGLANFYRRFIYKFSDLVAPLYLLIRKGVTFQWNVEQQSSFDSIKSILMNENVLKYFDPRFETLLETDSSGYGIAAVLMQRKNKDTAWCPVHYASRTLNAAEQNYSNIEREALSVVFGVEKFRQYLLGTRFIIRNDQQPLKKLLGKHTAIPTSCSARLQRWALRLSLYDYVLEYSKGADNVHSDCFSRLPISDTIQICEPYELVFAIQSIDAMPVNCTVIREYTNSDPNLCELIKHIKYGWPIRGKSELHTYRNVVNNMSLMKGCILYNNRVLIPKLLRKRVLEQFHEGHPGISAMKVMARSLIWYQGMDRDIELFVKSCEMCKSVQSKPRKSNHEWPIPNRVWSRIHVDHFFYQNHVFFIVIDALSKYIEVEIVNNTSVQQTINALKMIFSRNGLCDTLVSDNASCFTAKEFKEFLKLNGIEHMTPPPYSPASNGQAERGVRVIKDLLKKNDSDDSLRIRLAKILLQYRSTPHSITQIAPSVSLNNRKLVTVRDRINPNFCTSDQCKLKKMRQFDVGDSVLVLNLREGEKWLKGTIVEKLGINIYSVLLHSYNQIWKRHVNQLLPCVEFDCNMKPKERHIDDDQCLNELEKFPQNISIPDFDINVKPNESVQLRRSSRIRKSVNRYGS